MEKLKENTAAQTKAPHGESEAKYITLLKGFVGALIGALPGMLIWVILAKFRIRAALVGFFIAAGTVYGYGKLSRRNKLPVAVGAIVCMAIIIISVYLAQRITIAWAMTDAYKDYVAGLKEQLLLRLESEHPDIPAELIEEGLNNELKERFGFSRGTFSDCFTHFHMILSKFGMKKEYYSDLIQSYISAALGSGSLMKNAVKKRVTF